MVEPRKTPLYDVHIRSGGKVIDFSGWLLPVQYAGILDEHRAVREKAGIFDVSHMGEVRITGPQALPLIQKLVTNDVSKLSSGQILYTPMCYPTGGTVDDLLVYKYGEQEYFLVINAGNIEKDWEWMQENSKGFDADLVNLSDETAEIAIQGPAAEKILQSLTESQLASVPYYHFLPAVSVAGKRTMISRTGYTGEDGFEIYCRPEDVVFLWDKVMEAGQPFGLIPTGLGCRDTLRFEACMPLYGHELAADITPLEAGLSRFVRFEKGSFNGYAALEKQKQEGLRRRLVCLEMVERGIARANYQVFTGGEKIGWVTTGTFSPTLNKNLAMALIADLHATVGQNVDVEIREKLVKAQIITRPFYKRGK